MGASSLSLLAQAIRDQLFDLFKDTELHGTQIVIGPPHEAAKQQENEQWQNDYLCVFLYRMGYSGFPTDATSADPLYLKAFCMITALGRRSNLGNETTGDLELKLIGAVAECFHKKPVLRLEDENSIIQSQLQIVPVQLTLDDINHLWATQNNTPYRLSLSYEFALLPVPMKTRVESGPRVSAISLGIRTPEHDPEKKVEKSLFAPQVPLVQVDTNRLDWTPHICLLNGGEPTYTLEEYEPQTPVSLILLGDTKTPLSLEWEIWNQAERSWKTSRDGNSYRPASDSLLGALKATAIQVSPALDKNDKQALLRATRQFTQEGHALRTLASNPVLITVKGS